MGDSDDCPTPSFGPDGSITDPVLLRLIEDADPLPPGALLKLASFFAQMRTYTVLADTLVASALLSRVDQPPEAKNLETPLDAEAADGGDTFVDTFIDNYDNSAERRKGEDTSDDRKYIPSWFFIHTPGPNFGLLIEKIDKKSFAVAVSPNPAAMSDKPDDQAKLLTRRAVRKARHTSSQP